MKYNFKNYDDYKNQRQTMYNDAEQMLANGDVDKANELMAEMETMDAEYEAYATAQANLRAAQNPAATAGLAGLGVQNAGGTVVESLGAAAEETDLLNTREYQDAFMNLVCSGVKMPEKFQSAIKAKLSNATTAVTDTTAVIPTTTLREIIRELKASGELYGRVRKTNVQGGLDIPILTLKPEAKWFEDGSASEDQKLTANTKVSFSYYGLECKISQTLIANVTNFAEFTELFVPLAVEAIMTALDKGIISGTGVGQMTGIAVDKRIPEGNVIEMTAEEVASWAAWKKKVFAKMKKAYRDGIFVTAQGTFDANIDGMVDLQGQPIARVNYGITDGEKYRFGGKEVLTVDEDVMPAFDSAAEGDVFAVFLKPSDYIINTNLQMRVDKWRDNDNNQEKVKVTLVCDGKIADPNGVLIIKKKVTA